MPQSRVADGIQFALQVSPNIGACSIGHAVRARGDEGRAWKAPIGGATFLPAGRLPSRLFLALSHADIEADHAVLIARAHHRNVALDVVLALNNLLRTLRDVGAVSERNIIGELLLNRNLRAPRRGVRFGRQALRIDFDPADSEELLHAAAYR